MTLLTTWPWARHKTLLGLPYDIGKDKAKIYNTKVLLCSLWVHIYSQTTFMFWHESDLWSKRKRIKINISKYFWKLKCTWEAFMKPDSFLFPWRENTLLIFQCQRGVDLTTTTKMSGGESWPWLAWKSPKRLLKHGWCVSEGVFRQDHLEEMGASPDVGSTIRRGRKKKTRVWACMTPLSRDSHLLRSEEYLCHVSPPSPFSAQTPRAKQPPTEPPETTSQ